MKDLIKNKHTKCANCGKKETANKWLWQVTTRGGTDKNWYHYECMSKK